MESDKQSVQQWVNIETSVTWHQNAGLNVSLFKIWRSVGLIMKPNVIQYNESPKHLLILAFSVNPICVTGLQTDAKLDLRRSVWGSGPICQARCNKKVQQRVPQREAGDCTDRNETCEQLFWRTCLGLKWKLFGKTVNPCVLNAKH